MSRPLSDRVITIYCGLLMAVTAFSIDITLPFFSQIREAMQASDQTVFATITVNIFCLGIGQLFFGSISDRFGRKRAAKIGLSIYLLGAVVAFTATSMTALLLGRALQGFGGGAAPVVARAIIRDRFTGDRMAQNMALASGIFSIGPILAPLIGAGMIELGADWRAVFGAMTLMAALLLAALSKIPETLAKPNPDALKPRAIAANVTALFSQRQSRYFLLLSGWTMICIVMIISGMPVVMETAFGVTGSLFAVMFAMHGLGIIFGQWANHWLIGRIGTLGASIYGAITMVAAFGLIVLLTWFNWLSAWGLAILIIMFALGYLPVYSNAASMTLEHHGQRAGFAAAFFGAYGQLFSATATTIFLAYAAGSLITWSSILLVVGTATLIGLLAWKDLSTKAVKPSSGNSSNANAT